MLLLRNFFFKCKYFFKGAFEIGFMIESISDPEIEKARRILNYHIVNPLTRDGALEVGLFCICSQATPWEIACRFVHNLRDVAYHGDRGARNRYAPRSFLIDKKEVDAASERAGWRFANMGRFDEFIDYFGSLGETDAGWWNRIKGAGVGLRGYHVERVKWLSSKTFSFWNICLGGTKLLALDVYVMTGLRDLGIDIPESFVIPQAREVGSQKVRKTPSAKKYLEIEQKASGLFQGDSRFTHNGEVDLAMVDAVLWWGGANRGEAEQGCLFGSDQFEIISPYGAGRVSSSEDVG